MKEPFRPLQEAIRPGPTRNIDISSTSVDYRSVPSGDVLSGILGSLLARGTPPQAAAALAAQALGEAADIAAAQAEIDQMNPKIGQLKDFLQTLPEFEEAMREERRNALAHE